MPLSWLRNGITQSSNIGKYLIEYVSTSFSSKPTQKEKGSLYKTKPISNTWIKISKLTTKTKYKVEKVSDTKFKFEKVNTKANIINIITIYASTSKIPWLYTENV